MASADPAPHEPAWHERAPATRRTGNDTPASARPLAWEDELIAMIRRAAAIGITGLASPPPSACLRSPTGLAGATARRRKSCTEDRGEARHEHR